MMILSFQLDRWIRRISQGDRDALESLYHATRPAVYAFALSITQNRHDAEDVLQDCYLAIWNNAASYRSDGKPVAWIMTITRNLCFKLSRQQQRYLSFDPELYLTAPESDPEDRLLIQRCMTVLTEEERQIVLLHAVAGCTHREIGNMLGLKLGTVLSKYHRALQKLREAL